MIKLMPNNEKELFKMLDDLLADIKQTNKDIVKIRIKQKEFIQEIDTVETEFNQTERELKRFEKDMVTEMDKAVLEFCLN